MSDPLRFYHVRVEDREGNAAFAIVSAAGPEQAGNLAVAEVRTYEADGWTGGGKWKVSTRAHAITELAPAPARVLMVKADWT